MPARKTDPAPRVRLRDVTLEDADMLDAWAADPARQGGFNDFGMPREPTSREALEKGPLRNERNGLLIVERVADGVPIGDVSWHRVTYGPNPESAAWNVGIDLVPDARGQGFGSEAQRLLAAWLFEHTDVHRVEASTDIENVAEQRALEKAGFTREGIARSAQFRAGRQRDLVTFAKLRDDPA
jgi:RimJ/RimL family protein N-acetyltransferase